jgi:hypothetical protein
MHFPKNFEGTRTQPNNKVVCTIGRCSRAVSILINLNSALADCNIIVPTVQELSDCKTVQDVANIPAPGDIGLAGFKGSLIFLPGPVLRNAILTSTIKHNRPIQTDPPHNGNSKNILFREH